jgi:hypothetical protein
MSQKKQHSSRQYRLFATNCIVSRQMVDEKINEHLKEKISFYGLFDFTLRKKKQKKISSCCQSLLLLKYNQLIKYCFFFLLLCISFIQYVRHVFIFSSQKEYKTMNFALFFLSIRRSN